MRTAIRKVRPLILTTLLVFFIVSCDTSRVYEEWADIPTQGWHKDSLCYFNIDISDTLSEHNLIIGIRNENNYAYQNLWLFITSEAPAGQSVTDTLQYDLANTSGKWYGSGWGSLYTSMNYFKPDVRFAQSGRYRVTIGQGMREEQLKGIRSIGFRVETSK